MEAQDYSRFLQAIDDAIHGLELEARCYGYTGDEEHTDLIAILNAYKQKIEAAEKADYLIWKAMYKK